MFLCCEIRSEGRYEVQSKRNQIGFRIINYTCTAYLFVNLMTF